MKYWIIITTVFLSLIVQNLFSQGIEHKISFPAISYIKTNISEFGGYVNRNHYNEKYIPNIRYELQYRNYILGIDHFNSNNYNEVSSTTIDEWTINTLNIDSYAVFGGYQYYDKNKLQIKSGAGVTFNSSYITSYAINYFFEGYFHYEESKYGAVFWSSIDYRLLDSFFIACNVRYSPMFNSFWDESDCLECVFPHEKNKLHYMTLQLSVGYSF